MRGVSASSAGSPVRCSSLLLCSSTSIRHTAQENWLLFNDSCGLGNRLAQTLRQQGHCVTLVSAGTGYGKAEPHNFVINPAEPNHYNSLLEELRQNNGIPNRILHLWTVTAAAESPATAAQAPHILEKGFYTMLCKYIGDVVIH